MSGGMRIDPKGLPLSMQEQVATKILAQIPVASPVAGSDARQRVKVRVHRLRFPSTMALARYYALRSVQKDGKITGLHTKVQGDRVNGICYQIVRGSYFQPSVEYIVTDFVRVGKEMRWEVEEPLKW